MDIAAWLHDLGLQQYEQAFYDNAIDGTILSQLTADDLKDLGVHLVGHRRKLLAAIAELRSKGEPKPREATDTSTAERRQLTVMFCDLVGSTALSARLDPEDLHEVIAAYHRAVAAVVRSVDGFVAKYMGDGVLVYFGYPQAHEEDAERAVRAGLGAIDAVRRLDVKSAKLQARVGIATGLVVVGDLIGQGEAQERGVVGETPNLAARVQELAPPGGVIIAEGTRRLIGDLFELRDLGVVQVKSFAAPVPVWQALRPSAVDSRFEALRTIALTPLVGREEEVELLLRRWQRVTAGDGQVVLLSGEPGIGKSRLTAALRERLEGEPHTRVRYFCSPHHQDSALHPFIAQLERAAGFAHDDSSKARLDKLTALIAPGARDRDEVTLIADLLSLPSGAAELDLTPQRKREKLFAALLHQLEDLARQQPVLMVVEDLHWIDPSSRELLDLTVERAASLPVLLILTFRPEFQAPWSGLPQVAALTLNRLDRRSGAAMVARIAGNRKLPDALAAEIVERGDGVPLFVEELTRAVIEAGPGPAGEALAGVVPPPSSGVPPALHASLVARLDRLGPAAREIAQIGAVVGREFPYELIARAHPQRAEADLQAALGALTGAGLLFCRGAAPRSRYIFKHALIQEAAYQSLLRRTRQQYHRQVAELLEQQFVDVVEASPELLAHHYSEAGLPDLAIKYWQHAGERAARRSANQEAIGHLTTGLAQLAQLPETQGRARQELALQRLLGQASFAASGYASPEATRAFNRARELCAEIGDDGSIFPVLAGVFLFQMTGGHHANSIITANETIERAGRTDNTGARLVGNLLVGLSGFHLATLAHARAHFDKAIGYYCAIPAEKSARLAYEYGADPGAATYAYAAWCLWLLGYPDQALRLGDELLVVLERIQHGFTDSRGLYWNSALHACRREWQIVEERSSAAIASAEERGLGMVVAVSRIMQGAARAMRDPHGEFVAEIREALAAYRATGARAQGTFHLILLAQALAECGRHDEGLSALREATALAEETGERFVDAEIHRLEGNFRLAECGDRGAAAGAFYVKALEVARAQQARSLELRAACDLARLWAERGDRQRAADLLGPIYGWFTEGFDTPDLKEAKTLLEALNA